MKHTLLKHETLQWLSDIQQTSPEDDWISQIDGTAEEEALPPIPSLDGINDDLIWMWRCREQGITWQQIAEMSSLKTAAGAWKRFQKLMGTARHAGKKDTTL